MEDTMEYRQNILNYAGLYHEFGLNDICAYLESKDEAVKPTVSWYLTKLTETGQLLRIGHGRYTKCTKTQFVITPTKKQCGIVKKLKKNFPAAHFCIYDGGVISPLLHHLSANNITYLETDREAVTAVFNYLRDNGVKAYLRPSRDLIYNYIDMSQPAIFVKPLITESPVTECNGVYVPTLEKLLVDLRKDRDFFYLQDSEGDNILRNAYALYAVNQSRLLRYAARRGVREEISELLGFGK